MEFVMSLRDLDREDLAIIAGGKGPISANSCGQDCRCLLGLW